MQTIPFEVRGDHITLDALLKVTGLAPSGGIAKMMIADGLVQVDGQVELRKTCKIRPGQVVRLGETEVGVSAAAADAG
ncbi:MAG TPA: RNA-binding S4 domain-containing protein [Ideonella sp.]|nr:RNA-binding S4 domain-containing protein [Ideonella sp.]